MDRLPLLLLVALLCLPALFAEDPTKRPLDLPSGGRGDAEDEEDAPETISFYQGSYEGDAFFWCLDTSCSMGWGGQLGVLKDETISAIQSLSDYSEIGLVRFSTGHTVWNHAPQQANLSNKNSAIAWVNTFNAQGGTCLGPAGVACVEISNLSDKEHKRILMLSDGMPGCGTPESQIAAIVAADWQRTPVDTIYISGDMGGATFMQNLAAATGGTFRQVDP